MIEKKKSPVMFLSLIISVIGIIFLSLSSLSCQKTKESEGKKEVPIQKDEVEQQSSESRKEVQPKQETKPPIPFQNKLAIERKSAQPTPTPEKGIEFKEPVLVWEREFDPPLIDISDQNSAGEYIAIQGGGKEGRPTKILFLDSKGKTLREIPLGKKEKRKIPPEQVWLTYYGEEYKDEKFKKSFTKGKEIEVVAERVFMSGDGEYYAIVTHDTAVECAGPEADCYGSPWYEFSYYDRTGKFIWKVAPDVNYGFMNAHISHDGSRIILIDEAHLDYFGQKWYLFDEKGRLLKAEDHLLKTDGTQTQEDWDKEKAEWIMDNGDRVEFSPSAKYVASLNGDNWTKSKVTLWDSEGKLLWSKKFDEMGHHNVKVSNQGNLIVYGNKAIYIVSKEGITIFTIDKNPIAYPYFSKDGNFILTRWEDQDEEGLKMYETISGRLILKVNVSELFDNRKILLFSPMPVFGKYLIFIFSYGIEGSGSLGVMDIENKQVVWKKEKLGISSIKRQKNFEQLLVWGMGLKKVIVFNFLGGQSHEN